MRAHRRCIDAARQGARRWLIGACVGAALLCLGVDGRAADAKDDQRLAAELGMYLEHNLLQFTRRAAVAGLHEAWQQANDKGLRLVHMGDSHVKTGQVIAMVRERLQADFGDGGPGLIFPYSVARASSPREYRTTHTGLWSYGKSMIVPPRVPLGLLGVSGQTNDMEASFTLTFKRGVPEHWRRLRLFCKRQRKSFDLVVTSAGQSQTVRVGEAPAAGPAWLELTLPAIDNTLAVTLVAADERQTDFELYGLELTSVHPGGAVAHVAGVGGARFRSVLFQRHMAADLGAVAPHVVLVDFGTNDFLYKDTLEPKLEGQIRAVIRRIRQGAPKATVVLMTPQDLYFRGRSILSGTPFSDLVHRIASAEGCAVWDWYWVAGGRSRLRRWQARHLASPDLIHLTDPGSRLKGRLLATALYDTMAWLTDNPDADSLVIDRSEAKAEQAKLPPEPPVEARPRVVRHRVKRGEKLRQVARKYRVRVRDLKRWNRLRSSRLRRGQVLVIRPGERGGSARRGRGRRHKVRRHTVRSGESVRGIAHRHGITMEQLKRFNGLKSGRIFPGQVLRLEPTKRRGKRANKRKKRRHRGR